MKYKMITEDYISFETAKLLKKKGFEGDINAYYHIWDNGTIVCSVQEFSRSEARHLYIPAPTLQTTMKWLREVHNIHINLDIHWLYFANALGWMYTIIKILENGVDYIDSKGDENDKTFYSSYKEACEAAIKYCLKNLI